ncbi:MAG: motif protein [Gemmataceae bacterium]|nr:motif protein [Gemmataceae bacterium]
MPRLSTDRVKDALLHPAADVRSEALRYFAEAHSRDQTAMPVVIEALERYGRTQAFRASYPIAELAQSDPTIRWAVGELNVRTEDADTSHYLSGFARLLRRADPRLILPYQSEILAAPGFDQEFHDQLTRRLAYQSWDTEALWRELEAICEAGKAANHYVDMRWDVAEDVVDVLAGQGDQNADRVMALLGRTIDYTQDTPEVLLQPLAARLAGRMRFEPAVPLLVAKLHEDADLLLEECQEALIRIGTDAVVQAVRAAYPLAKSDFRLFAGGVLEGIHTDLAVEACIELLDQETDLDFQSGLAFALVSHFSTEGNEIVRQLVLDDPDLLKLRDRLVTVCHLMGQDLPELEQWQAQAEEEKREREKAREKLRASVRVVDRPSSYPHTPLEPLPPLIPQVPVHRTEPKVGRNDPCPCGSGKKFKKCCLNRTAS